MRCDAPPFLYTSFLSHPSYKILSVTRGQREREIYTRTCNHIANIAFYREKVRDRPHSAIEHYEVILVDLCRFQLLILVDRRLKGCGAHDGSKFSGRSP